MVPPKEGEIWAIGGGKGGTGKTFLISCLGTCLAKKGKSVILVDLDIGGANLHSFFGLSRPRKTLTSFFEEGVPLSELAAKTEIENMSLIAGDIHSIASDNIHFSQKLRLFRQLLKLHAQHVLIDMGGGSHLNTLDTFLAADKMIVILVPEVIAIENLYHFIKNSLFRKLKKTLKDYGFKEIVQHIWDRRASYGIKNLKEMIDHLKDNFSYLGNILDKELADFKIYLILNMIRNNQEILIGSSIKSVMAKYLGIPVIYTGYIQYSDSVWMSIRERRPFMLYYLSTGCAKEIELCTENLIEDKEVGLTQVF